MAKIKKNVENSQNVKQNKLRKQIEKKGLKIIEWKIEKMLENENENRDALNRVLLGARYVGKSEKDAKRILNNSQNGVSYPNFEKGYPRAHASFKRSKSNFGHICFIFKNY